jgi:hypothetical protein
MLDTVLALRASVRHTEVGRSGVASGDQTDARKLS